MSSQLGNVISRLQGLKNVSGRRVMPGQEFMQEMEPQAADVSGAAMPQPQPPMQDFAPRNRPALDQGGSITPQSYDVRANTSGAQMPPPSQAPQAPPADPSLLERFGTSLANLFKSDTVQRQPWPEKYQNGVQPQQIAQAPAVEQMQAPVSQVAQASAQPEPGILSQLADWISQKPSLSPQAQVMTAENQGEYFTPAPEFANHFPEVVKNTPQIQQQIDQSRVSQSALNQEVERAAQEPWAHVAYGSAMEVANSPALQSEFKKITGMDYKPEIAQQVSKYEEAMKGVEDRLNGINSQLDPIAEGISQRILANQSTDDDLYYMGMALLMPLILGGVFGKEVGVGALGGGAKGFADALGQRQQNVRADEASLLDVNKQQASIQEKLGGMQADKAKFKQDLEKNVPDDPNAPFLGMEQAKWTDPETGKELTGIKILPGFVARKEKMNTEKDKERMEKAASELSNVKTYVDEINDITGDVLGIVDQLKDPNVAWKALTQIITGKAPSALAKLSQEVEYQGRKVNAGILLKNKLGLLTNAYGQAKELGQADAAMQRHVKTVFENPTDSFVSPEQAKEQLLSIRELAQKGLVNSAKNHGFYPEFMIQEMEQANNPLFQKMNKKEDSKQVDQLVHKAMKSEVQYAK